MVRDCGLVPEMVQPDFCLNLTYPHKCKGFNQHFDSRYRWGEHVVGINLGSASTFYLMGGKGKTVNILLPWRSVYVMVGPARTDWKHGVRQVSDKWVLPGTHMIPDWNPLKCRRSITMRSTKAYSDVALKQQVEAASGEEMLRLLERHDAQSKFPAAGMNGCSLACESQVYGKLSKERLLQEQAIAAQLIGLFRESGSLAHSRFAPGDVHYGKQVVQLHLTCIDQTEKHPNSATAGTPPRMEQEDGITRMNRLRTEWKAQRTMKRRASEEQLVGSAAPVQSKKPKQSEVIVISDSE